MKNKLIVFATYWNEIDWIHASLEQIDALAPCEVIICDGCFDSRRPPHSTDGTKKVIEEFVRARPHATLVPAVRTNRANALWRILRGHGKGALWNVFTPARLKSILTVFMLNQYRLNQTLTFQGMIRRSRMWAPGFWFMTYDSDQFYSDSMIEAFRDIGRIGPASIAGGSEITFFENFDRCTDAYEGRVFNNMPHRILPGTNIMPTRDIVIEDFRIASLSPKNFMKSDRYIAKCAVENTGSYHHYKFRPDPERTADGYALGDRKAPSLAQYEMTAFTGKHPKIIERVIEKWRTRSLSGVAGS